MINLKTTLAFIVVSFSLVACGGSSNDSHKSAQLRAVHLSPDAPAVDIGVNDDLPLTAVSYRQASQFLTVDEGDTNLKVLVSATDTAVIDTDLTLAENMKYTVIASGLVADIEPIVITDDNHPPTDGKAAITVVHGSPSAPAVDVYVTAPTAVLPARTGATLTDVPFKTVSGELELDAGDYRIRITGADSRGVVYDSGTLNLADGVEYIAIAADDINTSSLVGLTILTDLESTPFVNVDNMTVTSASK